MPTDENQERAGLSRPAGGADRQRCRNRSGGEAAPAEHARQRRRAAARGRPIEASYRALAGSVQVELETVAVLEEVAKHSLSLWLRVRASGDGRCRHVDASLLKFLARGTLAIIAWMDGSPTLQLADLQQAIRVLAWGTSITTTAHPVLPSSAELVECDRRPGRRAKASLQRQATRCGSSPTTARPSSTLASGLPTRARFLLARKLVNHSADMIFVVEMPDYQATRPVAAEAWRDADHCLCRAGHPARQILPARARHPSRRRAALQGRLRDVLRSRSRGARRALSDRRDRRGAAGGQDGSRTTRRRPDRRHAPAQPAPTSSKPRFLTPVSVPRLLRCNIGLASGAKAPPHRLARDALKEI